MLEAEGRGSPIVLRISFEVQLHFKGANGGSSLLHDDELQRQKPTKQRLDAAEYEQRFIDVSNRMEKLLRRAIMTGLALLFVTQLLLSIPSIRKLAVKVERLEGIPFERINTNRMP